jgi:hypothetical protein
MVAKVPVVSKDFTPIDSLNVSKIPIITGIYRRLLLGFIFAKVNPW